VTDPATPPANAAEPDPKRSERPHPLTPLIRGWVVLLALLIGFGREVLSWFTDNREPPPLLLLLGILGGVVVAAIAVGLLSWLTTQFVIDSEELRIETGILARKSQRIAFDKVTSIDVLQPLAARVFVLAELQIDIGSADRVKLRYLSRARAYALRDYLLSRAHGHRAEITETGAPALQLTDLSKADQVVVRLTPRRLVIGAITSNEFVGLLLTMIVTITLVAIFSSYLGGTLALIALAISAVSGIGGFIGRRITGQFNFTLSTRPAGLRISRGLTSLTSQSLPPRRIQLVRLSQSFLWRRLGWYRVEIDVLGVGLRNDEDTRSAISSVLLPVADAQQLRTVLTLLWPESDYASIELHPAPFRTRWLHPTSGPFLAFGYDQQLVVSRHGWLERRWDLVPHARVQSVRIWQGPFSRRLSLANLAFHTAGNHLSARALGLDADQISSRQAELIELAQAHRPDITSARSAVPDNATQAGPEALRADQAEATISSIE
jgi:putative membrane protein